MEEDIRDGWIEKGSPVERNASLHRGKTSLSQERASTICIFQSWTGPRRWDGWSKPGMGGENSIKNKKKGKEEKTRRRGIIYSRVALNQRWNQSRKTCDNEGGWKRREEECRRCSLRSEIFGLKKKRKKNIWKLLAHRVAAIQRAMLHLKFQWGRYFATSVSFGARLQLKGWSAFALRGSRSQRKLILSK